VSRRRVLLTGAGGFIGANLARRLLADGHDLHLLLRPGHQRWRLEAIAEAATVHHGDIRIAEEVRAAMERIRPDWIFHLAAYGAYPAQRDLEQAAATNVVGTLNLSQAALAVGFEAFVNAGSSSEYGFKDRPPAEDAWLDPNSAYAATKAGATILLRHLALEHRVRITTLRLYSIYGPWEEPSRLLPNLVVLGLDGELPPLVSPDIARDFVYVDDCCDAFLLAALSSRQPGSVYNVGSGIQTTIREAVAAARTVLNIAAEPSWGSMEQRSWDTKSWVADSRLIREELGWEPRTTLAEGIESTAAWFRRSPAELELYRRSIRAQVNR
jgi:UDP-glucose 4-epimerase